MVIRLVAILVALLILGGVSVGLYVNHQAAAAMSSIDHPMAPASAAPIDDASSDIEDARTIPIDGDRLAVRDVIAGMYVLLGHDVPPAVEDIVYTVNTGSFLGRAQLGAVGPMTRGIVNIDLREDDALLRVDRARLDDTLEEIDANESQWLDRFARSFADHFGGGRKFGTRFIQRDGEAVPVADAIDVDGRLPERVVLLVHGLDDPGWLWRDVIPALQAAEFDVARFDYPNDGPIDEAADMLARELGRLRELGVERVDLVAHSMGGLVSRDVLTRPEYYAGDGSGARGEGLPAIDRLIMLGTPNAGSQLARIRALSEIKEQITRAFRREGNWMGALADGDGQAGDDLLPGSPFLEALNARPNASYTRYTIVAGRVSPVSENEMGMITSTARMLANSANPPEWLRTRLRDTERSADDAFAELVRGVGDGCVTLDSARLEGVRDFNVVEANHVSMIAEIIPIPGREPAAIPIVLDRLER